MVLTGSDPPTASALLRLHATEFLLKQTLDPAGLANAIRHCLEVRAAAHKLQATLADLRHANEAFAAVLRTLPIGVVLADADGKVALVNDGAAALLQVDSTACIGQSVLDLLPGAARSALGGAQAASICDCGAPRTDHSARCAPGWHRAVGRY